MKYSKYNFWILWFLLLIIIACSSCSPQQRLANLLSRHPELVKTDTIHRRDTIWTKSVQTDTVFRTQITKDTVIIRENNLTVKYFNDGKTTYLKGTCDTIRIIREVPVIINSVEAKPETFWAKAYRIAKDVLLLMTFGALIVLFFLLKKSMKPL